MHYLQTLPAEDNLLSEDRDQLTMEYRRQSTLPAQRSQLLEQYRALPLPLRSSIDSDAGGKPRSFTLPRDSGLHAILAASAAASDQREPHHYQLDRARGSGQTHSMSVFSWTASIDLQDYDKLYEYNTLLQTRIET